MNKGLMARVKVARDTVSRVESMVGAGHKEWGEVDPKKIVVAACWVMLGGLTREMGCDVTEYGKKKIATGPAGGKMPQKKGGVV